MVDDFLKPASAGVVVGVEVGGNSHAFSGFFWLFNGFG